MYRLTSTMKLAIALLVAALGLGSWPTASASEPVLDPMARIARHSRAGRHAARPLTLGAAAAAADTTATATQTYLPMILKLAPGADAADLAAAGVVVLNRRAELMLACVPTDRLDSIAGLGIVQRASLSRPAHALLDRAAAATGAAAVVDGLAAELPYTGRGVVAGFADIGFDPGHATFGSRVVGLTHIDDTLATVERRLGAIDIATYTTDNPRQYHATHVAGILAGSGDGTPYRGAAPGADIFATTSLLYDTGILAGVEDIIDYAHSHGQPAVVNLSLGSAIGPRDGSDLFCQYLDRCAAEVPIVMSSGNDGDSYIGIHHTFSDEQPTVSVMLSEHIDWTYNYLQGYCDAWSADSRPAELAFAVFDIVDRRIVHRTRHIGGDTLAVIDASTDPDFARYYAGQIIAAGEVNAENGRYNLLTAFNLASTEQVSGHRWARYYLCVDIHGDPGTHIDFTPDGNSLLLDPVGGAQNLVGRGDNSLSISSMACGKNTICVGSATTRDSAPLLDGGTKQWTDYVTDHTVSAFTSYGTAADGRRLPHFCAPGAYVVSAASRYYLAEFPAKMAAVNARGATDGNYFFADCGTSMASPHAAGIFALWLEADPTLAPADLLDIAIATASTDGIDPADPRAGAGIIDAAAGLRYILTHNGLDLPDALARPRARRIDRRLLIDPAGAEILSVGAYDITGRAVDPNDLPAGPVVVRITTQANTYTLKI